jgi:hypothetical protein
MCQVLRSKQCIYDVKTFYNLHLAIETHVEGKRDCAALLPFTAAITQPLCNQFRVWPPCILSRIWLCGVMWDGLSVNIPCFTPNSTHCWMGNQPSISLVQDQLKFGNSVIHMLTCQYHFSSAIFQLYLIQTNCFATHLWVLGCKSSRIHILVINWDTVSNLY